METTAVVQTLHATPPPSNLFSTVPWKNLLSFTNNQILKKKNVSFPLGNAGRTTKFAPGKSLLELSHFQFRFTVFFTLGCGVDPWIPHLQFFQTVEGKAPKEAWGGHLSGEGINVTFLHPHEPQLSAMRCVTLNQIDPTYMIFRPIFCGTLSTLLHPVLASSFPLWQDFSKRASFPIVCVEWFYKKAVWGVVESWEFEENLSCGKILRIRRKNPMVSISRDYWLYLDITWQSFKIWEFWGEFSGIKTFYRSKFRPATGVKQFFEGLCVKQLPHRPFRESFVFWQRYAPKQKRSLR